jgi:hypothetical protein
MLVTLDGQKLDADFPADPTLAGLVHDVRQRFLEDRLIVGVSVNGESLVNDALQQRLTGVLATGDQVDLESGERREVVRSALRDAAREIAAAGGAHCALADALNTGRASEALEGLRDLVATWQMCQRAVVEGGALLGRDLTAYEFAGRSVDAYLRGLAEKLRSLRDVLDAHDMVALADLVYYELPPLCETWQALLEALATDV